MLTLHDHFGAIIISDQAQLAFSSNRSGHIADKNIGRSECVGRSSDCDDGASTTQDEQSKNLKCGSEI